MDFLKTWFPFSFRPADARAFVITVLIYLVLGAVGGVLMGLFSYLWLVGWVFKILGSLLDVYVLIGIVLTVLSFTNVIR